MFRVGGSTIKLFWRRVWGNSCARRGATCLTYILHYCCHAGAFPGSGYAVAAAGMSAKCTLMHLSQRVIFSRG